MMGSIAYGVSNENSDIDIYGFCTPPMDIIFPHLSGEIPGFGRQIQRFEVWQEACKDNDKAYDFCLYSIVKYFHLLMNGNPNIIDSLFVPRRCILHTTHVGELVRENRKIFLHKGAWHKFKGYAYSQMHKMKSQNRIGKRAEIVREFGYDVKYAYHVVRLLNEVEQILTEHDIDLEKSREQLKSIRRGEWKLEKIEQYFHDKESQLEKIYAESTLPWSPDEDKIKALLIECIKYTHKDVPVPEDNALKHVIDSIRDLITKFDMSQQNEISPTI